MIWTEHTRNRGSILSTAKIFVPSPQSLNRLRLSIQWPQEVSFPALNLQELKADKPPPSCVELRMRGPILTLPPRVPRHVLN